MLISATKYIIIITVCVYLETCVCGVCMNMHEHECVHAVNGGILRAPSLALSPSLYLSVSYNRIKMRTDINKNCSFTHLPRGELFQRVEEEEDVEEEEEEQQELAAKKYK